MTVRQNSLSELIEAVRANTQSNLELAASIRCQADAIADLAESVTGQADDEDMPAGLGHLGTL